MVIFFFFISSHDTGNSTNELDSAMTTVDTSLAVVDTLNNFLNNSDIISKVWTADQLAHACGMLNGENWITRPGEDCWPHSEALEGYVTYGPYEPLQPGNYNITWELAIEEVLPEMRIGVLQVTDRNRDQAVIKDRWINRSDFYSANTFTKLGFPFYIMLTMLIIHLNSGCGRKVIRPLN